MRSNGLHGFEVSETSGIFTLPSEKTKKEKKENPFSFFCSVFPALMNVRRLKNGGRRSARVSCQCIT